MNTREVYDHFGTPKGLQDHMLHVAGLVLGLKEHWRGPNIDWVAAVRSALLHDIGNVIKFDLDRFPELLGDELPRLEFWKVEQERLIEQYGDDDHVATDKMLDELHISPVIRQTIQAKSFGSAIKTAASPDWLPKILLYCDLRVLPYGVGTLDERLDDLKTRLKKYAERPDLPELIAACKNIEKEIQASLKVSLGEVITQENAVKNHERLLGYKIS